MAEQEHADPVLREVVHALAAADEPQQVVRLILDAAVRSVDADGGYIERVAEGDEVEVVAVQGWGGPAPGTRVAYPGSLTRQVIGTGKPELISDITREEHPVARLLSNSCGACGALVVPLASHAEALGALVLLRTLERPGFTGEEVSRVTVLADLGSLTFRRVRLLDDAERRAREESALRHAAAAVGSIFTISGIIEEIVQSALMATDSDGALMERIVSDGDEVEVVAVAGSRSLPLGARVQYAGSLAEHVLTRGEPQIINLLEEERERISPDLLRACPDCSGIAVPFRDATSPIGALILLRSPELGPFRAQETVRARIFAELAALAFRKVQLLEESERRRTELVRVMESRSKLMRGFSHDVKNPLGAADGHLQLLEGGTLGPLQAHQMRSVHRARAAVADALRLIDDLLDLARAETGDIRIERQPMDLAAVVRQLTEEYRVQAEGRGLTLAVRLQGAARVIRSDPGRIRQVLSNLLSNAVKYTRDGGITVVVDRECNETDSPPAEGAPWVAVHVRDTGPGISEDHQERMFEEFQRLDSAPLQKGAGIGLAISRRLAAALGGRLTVQSRPGEGATFTLWLPGGENATEPRGPGRTAGPPGTTP